MPKLTQEYINKIEKYDKVLTLNYIEEWDKKNKVIYLHGNLKEYCDIGSKILSANNDYKKFKTKDYVKIYFRNIIFIPTNEFVNKEDYVSKGLLPSDRLFPAEDLFLFKTRDIYQTLDSIESIDIFGVSPYGDISLINRLKKIKIINIYVFNLNEKEIQEWEKHGIKYNFINSKDFFKKI